MTYLSSPRTLSTPIPALVLGSVLFLACTGTAAESQEVAEAIPAELLTTEAGQPLLAGLTEAQASERLVFLHTGADW